ncbi:MAG TPA: beta-propeller fold lactonase family protein [Polyangia bacterium]|nr:beta-propeller fold lactonase family protein [Polyangia bacterium]
MAADRARFAYSPRYFVGLTLLMAAVGCGSSSGGGNAAGGHGGGAGSNGGAAGAAAGTSGGAGAGGSAGAAGGTSGGAGSNGGAAGTSGGAGTGGSAGGAAGTSGGAGAGGSAGGTAGTSGGAGTGGSAGGAAGTGGGAGSNGGSAGGAAGTSGGAGSGGAPGTRPQIMVVGTYLGGIFTFTLDPTTGVPSKAPDSPVDTGTQLYGFAVHASGDFLYAVDYRGDLRAYRVNRDNGALAPLDGFPMKLDGHLFAAATDRQGRFLYLSDSENAKLQVFKTSATTGALVAATNSPFTLAAGPAGIAFNASGTLAYVSSASLTLDGKSGVRAYTVDLTSGAPTELATSPYEPTTLRAGPVVLHPSGNYLYDGALGLHAFSVDTTTGALTKLANSPFGDAMSDPTAQNVAVDPLGQYVYATYFPGTLSGYALEPGTGRLMAVPGSPVDHLSQPYSVAVDPTGRFLYVGSDSGKVLQFAIERATGKPIAGGSTDVNGLQPEVLIIAP